MRQSNRLTVEDRDRLDYYQELRTADASASPTYALRTIYAPAATDPNSPWRRST